MLGWFNRFFKNYSKLRAEFIGMNNTEIMKKLYKLKLINSLEPDFIYKKPKVEIADFFRIEGMLLGIAIGDSLGNTTEFVTPHERANKYLRITDYLPNKHLNYKRIGLPSDDTQLSFDTLIVILRKGKLDMEELAKIFSSHRIFGIGSTVKQFLKNYKDSNNPWFISGVKDSLGNGAIMRIAPIIISPLRNHNENLWADTILATMLTHNNPLCIGASVAYMNMILKLVSSKNISDPKSLVNEFADIFEEFVGHKKIKTTIRKPNLENEFSSYPSKYIKETINYGLENNMSILDFGDTFGSSGHILETSISMLYTFIKHFDNPHEALIQAVTYTKDNDTIASILGAALGAYYGKKAFKESWIKNLSGRIREYDDGTVFMLINETKKFLEYGMLNGI